MPHLTGDHNLIALLRSLSRKLKRAPFSKELKHLAQTIRELPKRKFTVAYGKLEEDKESAHFDAVSREILVDTGLKSQLPEFQEALLVHELQHAYDHFRSRPYTLESETRAFKAECLYLLLQNHDRLAAKITDFFGYEWLDYLHEGVIAYLEGPQVFDAFVTGSYVKSRLGHRFDGLQTVGKLLADARQAIGFKETRLTLVERSRQPNKDLIKKLLQTQLATLERLRRQLEHEERANKTRPLALTVKI
ncbi:MAG: hypothetical protein HY547_06240 [Elusimicrobia bacterium]|nr:hypothetical protein [Elusimicrobiota bacterium]